MTSSVASVVAQFPCPKWCGLPVDHEFTLVAGDVEVRHHERDVFAGDVAGYLVVRALEVRIGGTESAHGDVKVFCDGVERPDGDLHDLGLWLAEYTSARNLKPRWLEVAR
jgi:hypothetical protein